MVKRIFDLVFYKLYIVYKKKEKSPIYTSVLFMGLISLSVILFLGVSINLFTGGIISVKNGSFKKEYLAAFLALTELPFICFLYYRYSRKGKIKKLEKKYSDTKYDKVRSWHIFMLPVFFIILMLIMVFTFGDVGFLPGKI